MIPKFDRRVVAQFDWALFLSVFSIPMLGLVVLYSAGFDPESSTRLGRWVPDFIQSPSFVKQSVFLAMGLGVMLVGLAIPPSLFHKFAYPIYFICVLALVGVYAFGTVANGSRRWLDLGSFNLQPAEPMKLGLTFALARYLSKVPPRPGGYTLLQLVVPAALVAVPMSLIMVQPDLGTSMVVGGTGFLMILFVGIKVRSILFLVLFGALAAYPAWHSLHAYQQRRIMTLFDPDLDPLGSGYHIIQSKIAVGSGSLTGKGFLKGTQSQLEFLPEHTTDFIYSVLAEEWGFVGCVVVLCAYFLLMYRLLMVVGRTRDLFASLLVVGIGAKLFFHVVVNIGMVVGLFPVVGIPLPLFSYGGSSTLSTMFALGLALGVSMRRHSFSLRAGGSAW